MLSLLSPAVDFLNNAQPGATTILTGVINAGTAAYMAVFLVVYAVW